MEEAERQQAEVISGSWMKVRPKQDVRLEQWLTGESAAANNTDDSALITAARAGHDN